MEYLDQYSFTIDPSDSTDFRMKARSDRNVPVRLGNYSEGEYVVTVTMETNETSGEGEWRLSGSTSLDQGFDNVEQLCKCCD